MQSVQKLVAGTVLPEASTTSSASATPPSDAYLERLSGMQGTSMAGPCGDLYERNLAAATATHWDAMVAYRARTAQK